MFKYSSSSSYYFILPHGKRACDQKVAGLSPQRSWWTHSPLWSLTTSTELAFSTIAYVFPALWGQLQSQASSLDSFLWGKYQAEPGVHTRAWFIWVDRIPQRTLISLCEAYLHYFHVQNKQHCRYFPLTQISFRLLLYKPVSSRVTSRQYSDVGANMSVPLIQDNFLQAGNMNNSDNSIVVEVSARCLAEAEFNFTVSFKKDILQGGDMRYVTKGNGVFDWKRDA